MSVRLMKKTNIQFHSLNSHTIMVAVLLVWRSYNYFNNTSRAVIIQRYYKCNSLLWPIVDYRWDVLVHSRSGHKHHRREVYVNCTVFNTAARSTCFIRWNVFGCFLACSHDSSCSRHQNVYQCSLPMRALQQRHICEFSVVLAQLVPLGAGMG